MNEMEKGSQPFHCDTASDEESKQQQKELDQKIVSCQHGKTVFPCHQCETNFSCAWDFDEEGDL